jgi:hypothetical protein
MKKVKDDSNDEKGRYKRFSDLFREINLLQKKK